VEIGVEGAIRELELGFEVFGVISKNSSNSAAFSNRNQ
jgi:hypothetical protein